jgi:hypothetical protein
VGIPIVHPDWVDHCIKAHAAKEVSSITADSFPEFRLPRGFSLKHQRYVFEPDNAQGGVFDGGWRWKGLRDDQKPLVGKTYFTCSA